MILVTGGARFIGANFGLDWLGGTREGVVNLDKLSYAGKLHNLAQPLAKNGYGQYLLHLLQEKIY